MALFLPDTDFGFTGKYQHFSGRLTGQAEIQLAMKSATRQARPLSVNEVKKLHAAASDEGRSDLDRVMASHLLLMMYTRSRNSDLAHVHEISHELMRADGRDRRAGFIQIDTQYHKAARSVESKSRLLPILASPEGVVDDAWINVWIQNRKRMNLQVSGIVDGAIMPAPDNNKSSSWTKRPLTCSETTAMLRSFLEISEPELTSHSLKRTCLSWVSKAKVVRDHRRLLGQPPLVPRESANSFMRWFLKMVVPQKWLVYCCK
eukprot:Skav231265  [mRNA]  locus=scaffold2436:156424:157206:+ [translate_table: standard]